MSNTLRHQLNNLPTEPGIYQFLDNNNKLLYVGKAKNLRSRVRSYFQTGNDLSPAKKIMITETDHLNFTRVANETEALLLESNLIKQRQPPYNIVLKDDKSWLYFAIDYRAAYPRVTLERTTNTKGIKYFGPYSSASTARESLRFLKKILKFRTCDNPPEKPCFESSLGRCLGHNLGPGSKADYSQQIKKLEKVLKGRTKDLLKNLQQEMRTAARDHKFELAAKVRDQLNYLKRLMIKQNILSAKNESYDILGFARQGSAACICRLPIRHGGMLDADKFLLEKTKGFNDDEVMLEFLEQYYPKVTDRVKTAYLSLATQEQKILGTKLLVPSRGKKRSLVKMAQNIAATHLEQSAASWQRKEIRAKKALEELKTILKLPNLPKRIEGYDISNIQGQEAVGSMVVLTLGLLDSSQYRKFKIQGLNSPNDVAMLAQVLVRRFTKNHEWPKPDLVLLDGGAGQLSTVKRALDAVKIKIPLIALAKQEELIYLPNQTKPLRLPNDSPALLTLEELRDEAHRFGITFYRSRHLKKTTQSQWDEFPGVGPKLKKLLKNKFGSIKLLRQAKLEDVATVTGTNKARIIKNLLN